MNKTNYEVMALTLLIAAGFYLAEVAGSTKLLHASSYSLQKNDRKGLPEEMVITADELREKQLKKKNVIILDARSVQSYEDSHIRGAVLPLTFEYYKQEKLYKNGVSDRSPDSDKALKENMKKYSKDMPIVTYCSSGGCQASGVLALQIKRLGFSDVRAMEDGIQTWGKKGYPLEKGGEK